MFQNIQLEIIITIIKKTQGSLKARAIIKLDKSLERENF